MIAILPIGPMIKTTSGIIVPSATIVTSITPIVAITTSITTACTITVATVANTTPGHPHHLPFIIIIITSTITTMQSWLKSRPWLCHCNQQCQLTQSDMHQDRCEKPHYGRRVHVLPHPSSTAPGA